MSEDLNTRIKNVIIKRLNLDITPDQIKDDAPIFSGFDESGEGLGLDSIDALELVVGLGNEFKVTIGDEDMRIFESINTIAAFIEEKTGGN